MSVYSDVAELRIKLLGAEAKKDLESLKMGARDVNSELTLMENEGKKGTAVWQEMKRLQRDINLEVRNVTKSLDIQNASMAELRARKAQLNSELNKLKIGSKDWLDKLQEIEPINKRIGEATELSRSFGKESEKVGSTWARIKETFAGVAAALGLQNLIDRSMQFFRESIDGAAKLSDQWAGITKSTGMSKEEVQGLHDELKKIDTRTKQEDLLGMARIGGQIGVAKDEMLGFVRATDEANLALGDEFAGGAEEVAKQLGPLKTLFKETKDLDFGTAITQIGSAINELGAAGLATGPVVADFTRRIGSLGDLSPEIDQVMGLGASFQELGLTAEISAGGLANILLTATKETAKFAQHLGMTEEQFKALIRSSPNEMLLKLAESFKGMEIDEVVKQMDSMKIKSQEATKVLSLLKDQTDLVRDKQELASKAMKEATSLTAEFNKMNNTEAAQLEKSQKLLENKRVELGQKLLPTYIQVTNAGARFTAFLIDNYEALKTLIAFGITYIGVQKSYVAWTERQILIDNVKKAIDEVKLVLQGRKILATQAEAVAANTLTAAELRAVTATNAFNAALQKNAIILGITVLVVGLYKAYQAYSDAVDIANSMDLNHIKTTDEQIKMERKKATELDLNIRNTMMLNMGTDERKAAVERLMKVYPEYFGKMTAEQVSNRTLLGLYHQVNAEIERKIDLMAREKRQQSITDRLTTLKQGLLDEGSTTTSIYGQPNVKAVHYAVEYNKLLNDLKKSTSDLYNANVKNFNFEANAAAAKYKAGNINLQQYRDEIMEIQRRYNVNVVDYAKRTKQSNDFTNLETGNIKTLEEETKKGNKKKAVDWDGFYESIKKMADESAAKIEKIDKDYLDGLKDRREKSAKVVGDAVENIQKNIDTKELNEKQEHTDRMVKISEDLKTRVSGELQQMSENQAKALKLSAEETEKLLQQTERIASNVMQVVDKVFDVWGSKLEEQLDKADTNVEKFFAEQSIKEAKYAKDLIGGITKLASGDLAGGLMAIGSGLIGFIHNQFTYATQQAEAAAKDQLARLTKNVEYMIEKMEDAQSAIEGIAYVYESLNESNPFENIDDTVKALQGIYEVLKDWTPFEKGADLAERGEESGTKLMEIEAQIAEKIVSNYDLAIAREEEYYNNRIKGIEDLFNKEIDLINRKYDYLDQKAQENLSNSNLAVKEQLNSDLLGFITNEESKTSLLNEFTQKRSEIIANTALADIEITDDMTESQRNAILATRELRNTYLDDLSDWFTDELKTVLGDPEQVRESYSKIDTIINEAMGVIASNNLKYAADAIIREQNKNDEIFKAEQTKNANIENETIRHNEAMVSLAEARDAALTASFNRMKDNMMLAIEQMQNRYAAMVAAGVEDTSELLAALQALTDKYNNLFGPLPTTTRGGETREDNNYPDRTVGPRLASGTEYVDRMNIFPEGIDTVPARLTKGERVFSREENAALGNISNSELVGLIRNARYMPNVNLASTLSNTVGRSGNFVKSSTGMVNYVTGARTQSSGGRMVTNGNWQGVSNIGSQEYGSGINEIGVGVLVSKLDTLIKVIGDETNTELRKIREKPNLSVHDVLDGVAQVDGLANMSNL